MPVMLGQARGKPRLTEHKTDQNRNGPMKGFCLEALFPMSHVPCVVTATGYCKKLPFLFHSKAINLSPEALTPKQVTFQLQ